MAYAKEVDAKFIGHLDLARVFERAMRRAELPIAFSEGFNPHPKISFGSALALGTTSMCEYVDIELAQPMPVQGFIALLQPQLPKGITLLEGKEISRQAKPLMAVLNWLTYEIKVPLLLPVSQEKTDDVIGRFLAEDTLLYARYSKKGRQEKNLRPFIGSLTGKVNGDWLELTMELRITAQGTAKPVELVAMLRAFGELPLDVEATRVHRTGIYIKDGMEIKSPLEI